LPIRYAREKLITTRKGIEKMTKFENNSFDGKEIVCDYNGKSRHGVVELVRHCVEKGFLLTVKTDDGYRSFYADKIKNLKILN